MIKTGRRESAIMDRSSFNPSRPRRLRSSHSPPISKLQEGQSLSLNPSAILAPLPSPSSPFQALRYRNFSPLNLVSSTASAAVVSSPEVSKTGDRNDSASVSCDRNLFFPNASVFCKKRTIVAIFWTAGRNAMEGFAASRLNKEFIIIMSLYVISGNSQTS